MPVPSAARPNTGLTATIRARRLAEIKHGWRQEIVSLSRDLDLPCRPEQIAAMDSRQLQDKVIELRILAGTVYRQLMEEAPKGRYW